MVDLVPFIERKERSEHEMSKLFKLKKFFTLDEAARHFSSSLEEEVTKADIYSLALEGHLTISIRFQGMLTMSPGRIFEDTADDSSPDMTIHKGMALGEDLKEPCIISKASGFPMSFREWLFFGREIMYADGVWDLSMLGQEHGYIERLYREEAGGEGFGGFNGRIKAIVLKRDDSFCKLKDIDRPLGLPEREVASFIDNARNEDFFDCLNLDNYPHQLVVKAAELTRFINSLQDEPPAHGEKPLSIKRRNSLFILIRALCAQQGIDPLARGAATPLQEMTELEGTPLSNETIRQILIEMKKQ